MGLKSNGNDEEFDAYFADTMADILTADGNINPQKQQKTLIYKRVNWFCLVIS